ncbi:hypothetical protein, partial [Nocardia wallacei]|uniref:hypothetical protein n=1 Tax=Nocardia wallacei TaxID=480035 RepID=UPI0024581E26
MGDGIALNPVEQARQVFESLPDPARGVVEAVVFGGNLPRTEITRMRELADGLRARAGALGEHAQDAGSILAQQDSVGAFADGLREMLRSHEDGAGKLSEQALTLADQADGAANEAEKTICVMFAFGVELVFRIIRMLAAASAAGPAGQMAALPAVEATLVEGRAEAQLMRAGLKEAYGRLAAKTTAALSAMGPVRFAVTAVQSAALPMIVDGGVQVLQVAAGDRNFDPIGDERENPTGFDVTSILVAGAAGAGGAAGGTLAAKVGPKLIPRMETSRTLAGLVHGTAGAAAGLTAAAMITGWPEDYQHILAPMLNGAFAGTVHAQPGAHSRPGPAAGPVVDGGGMFTPPDSLPAGPPIKISGESRQAWETARAAWKAQPANTTAGGAGDPGAVAAGRGAAPVPSVATAPSVLAAAALAPVAAAAHPSGTTPAWSGAVASAPAAAPRAPGGDEVARGAAPAGPRVTSGAETAAPPKVPTSTTTRAGDEAVAVPAQPRDGEGQGSAAAHDARGGEQARGEGENATAPGGEGEGSATSGRRPGEGEQGDADGGTRSEQRGEDSVANDDAASGHPRGSKGEGSAPARRAADEGEGTVAEDGVAAGQPRGSAEPSSVAEDGVRSEHGARDEQRAEGEDATTRDGAHNGQREEGSQPADGSEDGAAGGQRPGNENPGATAEDGAPAAQAGERAGTSGDEGAAGSRDRADEVLADFHARSGEDVPEALKLSNMPDEVLQAGLFHEDAHESLIAGMEIIRRQTVDAAPGGMVLRTPQLEGGFEMARRPVQMLPGQGKTLMFMSYSLHQAVRSLREPGGDGSVLLVTTADGLAHREFTEYKRVLSRYGVDVLRADQNTGFGRMTPGRPAIVVATGETVGHLCNAGHTPPRRAVIDEMDAIVDRGEKTFIRSESAAAEAPEATAREVFAAHDFLADALAKGQLSHEDFGLKQLAEEVDVQLPDGSFEVGTEYWYDGQPALTPAGRAKVEALPGGQQWLDRMGSSRLDMAAAAEFTTRNKTHYVMDQGKIVIVDQGEHGLQRNPKTSSESRWSAEEGKASLAQAVEAKEIRAAEAIGMSAEQHGIVVRADTDSAKSITAAEIYGTDRFFDHITGASGTLTDLGHVLKTVYGLEAPHAVDPFNPSRLMEGQPDVHENTRAKLNALAGYAHDMWDGGQGRFQEILCHRNDLVEKQVKALLRAGVPREAIEAVDADRIAKWGAEAESKLQEIFDAAGEQGKILVINRQGQRGVDISVSDAVEAKGGMHVWMTEVPEHEYIYDQAKNRTARNGKSGTAQALMSPQDALIRQAMHLRGVREAVVTYQDAVTAHRADPTSATHDKLVEAGEKLGSLVPGLQQRAHHLATEAFIRTYAPITNPFAILDPTPSSAPSDSGQLDNLTDRSARLATLLGIHRSTATALATALDQDDAQSRDTAPDQRGRDDTSGRTDALDRDSAPTRDRARSTALDGNEATAHHDGDALPRSLAQANLPASAVETLRQYLDATAPGKALQQALFTDEQARAHLTPLRDRLAGTLGWDPAEIEGAEGMRHLGAAVSAAQVELARALGDDATRDPAVPLSDITPAKARDVLGEAISRNLLVDGTVPLADSDDVVAAASLYLATTALLDLVTELHRRSPNSCVNNGVTAMRVLCKANADQFTMPPGGIPLRGHNWATVRGSFRGGSAKYSRTLDEAVESLKNRPGGAQVLVYKWKNTERQGSGDADNHLVVLVNDSKPGEEPKLVVVDLAASRDGRTDDDFDATDLADRRTLLNKAVDFEKWQREQQKFLDRLPESERLFRTIDFDEHGDLVTDTAVRDMPPEETLDQPVPVDEGLWRQVDEAYEDLLELASTGSHPSGTPDSDAAASGVPRMQKELRDALSYITPTDRDPAVLRDARKFVIGCYWEYQRRGQTESSAARRARQVTVNIRRLAKKRDVVFPDLLADLYRAGATAATWKAVWADWRVKGSDSIGSRPPADTESLDADVGLEGTVGSSPSSELDYAALAPMVRGDQWSTDPALGEICKQRGFDGLPVVAGAAELDGLIAAGGREFFRGMSAAEHVELFRSGPYFPGRWQGVDHGNGTYVTTSRKSALEYADDRPERVLRMVMRPESLARAVDYSRVRAEQRAELDAIDAELEDLAARPRGPEVLARQEYLGHRRAVLADTGRFAAAMGYPGYHAVDPGGHYGEVWVILDRTSVTVDEVPHVPAPAPRPTAPKVTEPVMRAPDEIARIIAGLSGPHTPKSDSAEQERDETANAPMRPDPARATREELRHWATRLSDDALRTHLAEAHTETSARLVAVRRGHPPARVATVATARVQTALAAEQWRRIAGGGSGSATAVGGAAPPVFLVKGGVEKGGTRLAPQRKGVFGRIEGPGVAP